MRGLQIGKFKIGLDYSNNFTKGYVWNTETNEKEEGNIQDIYFDKQKFDEIEGNNNE